MHPPRSRGCSIHYFDSSPPPNLIVASILLVGADTALLEGITQALASAGHHVATAASLAEAPFVATAAPPLLAVIDRSLLMNASDLRGLGLAPRGAIVVFGDPATPLPGAVRRAVLAELPLERARLMALAAHVEARAEDRGRGAMPTPPESRPSR